ncbi:hypothetical protein MYMAC_006722 [Corallococcus macrosporus DSM 14697]|uniref:Uncharacterized protein n=1 Tax=Corallococcus macrosporus DSM 14697 TaxID=1189310 RepID=A0A250K4U3_9BACT|nr:hypothetical protein MYMAC_006722 [Corallococcus macrosporus DSM 14697]
MWSSRESIRAQLISLLNATPPESLDTRRRIVWMLGSFGGVEQLPLFRELLLNPNEDFYLRDLALRAGAKHGLELSEQEFLHLDAESRDRSGPAFVVLQLLSFARLASFGPAMEEALLRLSPGLRAYLLVAQRRNPSAPQSPKRSRPTGAPVSRLNRGSTLLPILSRSVVNQPPAFPEWLFARWYHADRHLLQEEQVDSCQRLNLCVALAWRERPEVWPLFTEWAAEAPDWDELRVDWGVSRDELARITRTAPGLHQRAAEALSLPLPDLIAHWGEEPLLLRIERALRTESMASRVPCLVVKHPHAYAWARDLLFDWDVAQRRVLYPFLCDAVMASEVRSDLLEHLSDHDRSAAVRWALAAGRYPGNTAPINTVLRHVVAHTPTAEDRPLLLSALHGANEQMRGLAVSGLVALGESGPAWTDTLRALVHESSPDIRIPAAAGLVQQGQREWLTLLRHMATEAPSKDVKANAIRWLGRLDGGTSRDVFAQVLASAATSGEDALKSFSRPLAVAPEVEAALEALSHGGTDEDLCLLLNAGLRLGCPLLLEELWSHHLARPEDRMSHNEPAGG